MSQKVPLVVINPEGKRVVIGECELDDQQIFATITNPEVAKKIQDASGYDSFSIVPEQPLADVEQIHQNVFDPKKKD